MTEEIKNKIDAQYRIDEPDNKSWYTEKQIQDAEVDAATFGYQLAEAEIERLKEGYKSLLESYTARGKEWGANNEIVYQQHSKIVNL